MRVLVKLSRHEICMWRMRHRAGKCAGPRGGAVVTSPPQPCAPEAPTLANRASGPHC
jgi:hypothetical protein